MSQSPSERPGERALVREIAALLAGDHPVDGVAFGDDLAPLDGPLMWSVDTLTEGVDFEALRVDWSLVGRKAMAVNLSDCAAMAARPVAALLSLVLSDRIHHADALAVVRGAAEMGAAFGCPIVGGDTNSWAGGTVISVTVAARMPAGRRPVRRCDARPGDLLAVTGPLGGSILGRHLTFAPRVREALAIAETLGPTAMIDISDGFAIDLDRLCDASGCGAMVDRRHFEAVIHDDARRLAAERGDSALEHALYDGEDFELIVALPPNVDRAACRSLGLTIVGRFDAERGLQLADDAGVRRLEPRGWEHFK